MPAEVITHLESLDDHYLSKPAHVDKILAACEAVDSSGPADSLLPATVSSLARVEWEHIKPVLADCGGNVSQAAKLLGLLAAPFSANFRSILPAIESRSGRLPIARKSPPGHSFA